MDPDAPPPDRPDVFLQRMRGAEYGPKEIEAERESVLASFETARRCGVKIALGSDTVDEPLTDYGEYTLLELRALIEFGMSVPEAIRAATEIAAQALGLAHQIGRVETGYRADLLVVSKNPTDSAEVLYDPANLRHIIADGVFIQ
jgi:imidazolonepropionase-like amidohydrolase